MFLQQLFCPNKWQDFLLIGRKESERWRKDGLVNGVKGTKNVKES